MAPVAEGSHTLPGNAVLPPHQGIIITRGLQELAGLRPQDLAFDTVTRLLGWHTHKDQVLSDTTVRTLVRTLGQILRQAEPAEVVALLERADLAAVTPQLAPSHQPHQRAAGSTQLQAAVDAALSVGETCPPVRVTTGVAMPKRPTIGSWSSARRGRACTGVGKPVMP